MKSMKEYMCKRCVCVKMTVKEVKGWRKHVVWAPQDGISTKRRTDLFIR